MCYFMDDIAAEFLPLTDRRAWWRRWLFSRKRRIRLLRPFRVSDSHGKIWVVDAGFESDGASIPQALWHIIGHPFSELLEPAILHDLLYTTGVVSRYSADQLLLQCMRAAGVAKWKQYVAYCGVRLFGGTRYKKRRRD